MALPRLQVERWRVALRVLGLVLAIGGVAWQLSGAAFAHVLDERGELVLMDADPRPMYTVLCAVAVLTASLWVGRRLTK